MTRVGPSSNEVSLRRYPNLKSVRELCYKRGYGKVNKQRTAITDNSVIETVLGEHGERRAERGASVTAR